MMESVWLDSNIFLRYLHADLPQAHQAAKKIFQQIEQGNFKGVLSVLVLNEILWILEKYYQIKREDFVQKILKLIALPGIGIFELPKRDVIGLVDNWGKSKLDWTDLYLSFCANKNDEPVASFDKDFKQLEAKVLTLTS